MEVITQSNLADYENVSREEFEKSNFLYSFSFLPKEERAAINSVYAFFSYIDNIVDDTPTIDKSDYDKKLKRLEFWDNSINKIYDKKENSNLLKPLVKTIDRFMIPRQYFMTLIDGCRRDLSQNRYETFEDLKEYCYSVASIVGLTCIEIFGYKYEDTKNYAINLGYALQLTNIIRDVKVDKDRGYIYLPKEDLIKFKYSEQDLFNEVYNDNFRDLMSFQVKRAREYYHRARSFMRPDERNRLIAAEIMDDIYFRLLDKIELNDYNIWEKKIKVSTSHKIMMALKHWLSVKLFVKRIKS
jgi:phytoene synthase